MGSIFSALTPSPTAQIVLDFMHIFGNFDKIVFWLPPPGSVPPYNRESWIRSCTVTGFPLGLENLEKWEGIFQSGKSQGILNRLEKSGKITQNTGKLREFEINIINILSDIKMNSVLFAKMDEVFRLKK